MENIRIFSKHVPEKAATEYALFFTHEGRSARMDLEIMDDAGLKEESDAIEYLVDLALNELANPIVVGGLPQVTTIEDRDARMEEWTAERGLARRADLEADD